ncbi:hypothetical protein OLL83_003032 [Shewanella algae]|uniref:hypothetical protein n=1 Tax=Shewanella algae TaxID=38313 RepID=UPI002231EA38|nr:hypothetical protein [Shewanella algae]UZD57267.1 hypothetical protein OLL83_003032 [Shewanella algae]
MFSLKVLIHLLAIVAAVVALWGKTNEGRKLTSLGTFLLMVIISSGVLSAYVMYEENQEKQAKEIAVTKAKAKVYTRMLSATEGIKRATLWKPYDPLADRLPPFSYQDGETNLLNPTPKQLSDITARFHDPMKGYTRMLKRYSEDYEAYLTFDKREYGHPALMAR